MLIQKIFVEFKKCLVMDLLKKCIPDVLFYVLNNTVFICFIPGLFMGTRSAQTVWPS
jgi:hypothetical protein